MVRVVLISKLASIFFIIVSLMGCGETTVDPSDLDSDIASYCNNEDENSTEPEVTISWNTPTNYTDSSYLDFSDIDSFKIYVGTESRRYNNVISISDPTITSCSIPSHNGVTYYIAMTVVLKNGRESNYSNEISRTI